MNFIRVTIILSVLCITITGYTQNRPVAFPGAEGFGKYTTGGRGGKVFIVKNLQDKGPGSLREAILKKEPRIIVFAVSGTIALESPLDINYGDLTIAGQTAPGDGICLRNYPVKIAADNVIIRYLRFRLGDEKKQQGDAFYGSKNRDIIIDHCSISWATDECASFYDNENFTMQWCIISEGLNASVHEKGEHGYGGIWGGMGATFHHNLLAHNASRNPRFCGARYHRQPEKEIVDFRNNVIYNWGHNSVYGGERGNHNIVGNYYKPGPATSSSRRDRVVNPMQPYGKFFVCDNVIAGNEKISKNNWDGGVHCDHIDSVSRDKPFPFVSIPSQSAQQAYRDVLKSAGASLKRDVIDVRIVAEVSEGNATYGQNNNGIIDSQKDAGGWPELQSVQPPMDSDGDGMPDDWEKTNKLNADDPVDNAGYTLNKQYTNIEIYLAEIIR